MKNYILELALRLGIIQLFQMVDTWKKWYAIYKISNKVVIGLVE